MGHMVYKVYEYRLTLTHELRLPILSVSMVWVAWVRCVMYERDPNRYIDSWDHYRGYGGPLPLPGVKELVIPTCYQCHPGIWDP